MSEPRRVLEAATSVLLIDWPNTGVPRALVEAGFTVFCYCPDSYSAAEIVAEQPADADAQDVYVPEGDEGSGSLVFRPIEGRPDAIDLVCVYRPPEELPGIIEKHVLPLGATTLWLQPPITSTEARGLAAEHGLDFVEGADIAETARGVGGRG